MAQVKPSRGLLGRVLSHQPQGNPHDREEQGFAPATNEGSVAGSGIGRPFAVSTTNAAALIPAEDKLLVFRALTGIDTVPTLMTLGHSARTAPNIGLYTRVVRAEKSSHRTYRVFAILINTCLGVQIIVAAVLTALGAANGPHKAVTAFGAINTIIAGIMTYLKGSGLPDRMKHHENEWKRVREYIEQREREFCLAECPLDVHEELDIVEDMYKKVKVQLESHKNPGSPVGGDSERSKRTSVPVDVSKHQTKRPESSATMPFPEKAATARDE